jgi:predicted transcriptional regulator
MVLQSIAVLGLDASTAQSYAQLMVIELTSEDKVRLAELADATRQSEADLAKEALHWFLAAQEESLAAAIKEGDDDFERGEVFEHHEVVAQFADVLRHQ